MTRWITPCQDTDMINRKNRIISNHHQEVACIIIKFGTLSTSNLEWFVTYPHVENMPYEANMQYDGRPRRGHGM